MRLELSMPPLDCWYTKYLSVVLSQNSFAYHKVFMHLVSSRQDQSTASQVLAQSYAQAPNITWFMGKANSEKLRYFFASLVRDAVAKKGAYLTPNQRGVLLLYNQQAKSFSLSAMFRKLHLMLFVLGVKNSIKLIRQQNWQSQFRPNNGLYGMALAIINDEHRWQTALEIKQGFLSISKQFNLPIYVETTNERIAKLYETIGFSIYHKAKHPYAELEVWFMKMAKTE